MEAHLEPEPLICEAFPGVEFTLTGDRDRVQLNMKDTIRGIAPLRILQLDRRYGTIDRAGATIPADFPGIPGRGPSRMVLTTEELAALHPGSIVTPAARLSRDTSGVVTEPIPGTHLYEDLEFRLNRSSGDANIYIQARQRTNTPGSRDSHWTNICYLDQNGALRPWIIGLSGRLAPFIYNSANHIQVRGMSNQEAHPSIPGLFFSLERDEQRLELYADYEGRSELFCVITQDGYTSLRPGTIPVLRRDPLGVPIPSPTEPAPTGLEATWLLTAEGSDDILPPEAGRFGLCPGPWRLTTRDNGDREYNHVQQDFASPPFGCTSFRLPPLATQRLDPLAPFEFDSELDGDDEDEEAEERRLAEDGPDDPQD